jgi:hypothetical protein
MLEQIVVKNEPIIESSSQEIQTVPRSKYYYEKRQKLACQALWEPVGRVYIRCEQMVVTEVEN